MEYANLDQVMALLLENINQDRGDLLLQCKDKEGNNPLHISCMYRRVEVMRVLIIEREEEITEEKVVPSTTAATTTATSTTNSNSTTKEEEEGNDDNKNTKKGKNNKKAKKEKRPKSGKLKFPGVGKHRKPSNAENTNENENNSNSNSSSTRTSTDQSSTITTTTNTTPAPPTTTTIKETRWVKVIDKQLVHSKNNKGNTPLHCCMESSGNLEDIQRCVTFLIDECGADYNVPNAVGRTAADLAKELGIKL